MVIVREVSEFPIKCEREVVKEDGTPYMDIIYCSVLLEEGDRIALIIKDGNVEKVDMEAFNAIHQKMIEEPREETTEQK